MADTPDRESPRSLLSVAAVARIGLPSATPSAGPGSVTCEDVRRYVRRAALILERHRALLDRLDAALGDGDHGTNMAIGFAAAARAIEIERSADAGDLLRLVGHTLVASVGGASGPLYGTAFIEAGFALQGLTRVDARRVADAFDAGVHGLARRGRCAVGDKTILDALQPAAQAFRRGVEGGCALDDALRSSACAAHAGMRATIPLVARRGLALRLGERSRGHRDPGAVSCFLLVRAMAEVRDGQVPSSVKTAARPARSVS
jgi:dihydroxyacetone kinase-like protein